MPPAWDFAEAAPLSDSSGSFILALENTASNANSCFIPSAKPGSVQLSDASQLPLPDQSAAVFFTDPPYYDAVPYSDLSDFFFVWLKRALPGHLLLQDPYDDQNPLTPKQRETVQDEAKIVDGQPKNRNFFEHQMQRAFEEGRRILKNDGIGCVVFAHKTTEGWEALLSGMIQSGWVITASWPISTERSARMRARDSAALATSIHLICRTRLSEEIGDWGEVIKELPKRVGGWIERLQSEHVRGADLVFACIGPALEIFSRYSRVETAEGKEVPLAEYLAKVWEVVGRTALEQVLGTAEAKARNGVAGALEEDARLTALFLWTLQSTSGGDQDDGGEDDEALDEEDEDDGGKTKKGGYSLIYDVARRFAQPLGIHLDKWESRIIETSKGVVRLLPVHERAKQLFGEEGVQAVAEQMKHKRAESLQMTLFAHAELPAADETSKSGRKKKTKIEISDEAVETRKIEATTLDRVHAAMLLQDSGQSNALRALLKAEQERGPDFVRLANALTALYPQGSEERRLLEAMLLAVPR